MAETVMLVQYYDKQNYIQNKDKNCMTKLKINLKYVILTVLYINFPSLLTETCIINVVSILGSPW